MKALPTREALGRGWECVIDLQYNEDGSCVGRGVVSCNGERRCVLLTLNVAAPEHALEKLRLRARAYMDEAAPRKPR